MIDPVVLQFIIRRSPVGQKRVTGIRRLSRSVEHRKGDEFLQLTQSQVDDMYQIEFRILQLREKGDSWTTIGETLGLDVRIARGRALLAIVHALQPELTRYSRPSAFIKRHG